MSNETNGRDSMDTLPNAAPVEAVGGEGSVEADRRYREGVKKTVASGEVEQLAEEAKAALDGSEGDELRAAEEKGKRGETPKRSS